MGRENYSQKTCGNAGKIHTPMLRLIGIEVARVRLAASTTLDDRVSCHLADGGLIDLLQQVIPNLVSALELPRVCVDASQEQILGEEIVPLVVHAPAGPVTLNALLNAVDEGSVGRVENLSLLIVLGGSDRGIAEVLWLVSAHEYHRRRITAFL
jgi:hypothetical protein